MGPQGVGMAQENFPRHVGWERPHPLNLPRPTAIPTSWVYIVEFLIHWFSLGRHIALLCIFCYTYYFIALLVTHLICDN